MCGTIATITQRLQKKAARPRLVAALKGPRYKRKRKNDVQREKFEKLVADALAGIPRRFRDAMSNLVILVEDEPSRELLRHLDIEPPDTLFGLYQGVPLTERGWDHGNTLPDQILVFQGPHERETENDDELVIQIGETLIHEIGHYFGLSEEEIADIEDNYWHRAMGSHGSPGSQGSQGS